MRLDPNLLPALSAVPASRAVPHDEQPAALVASRDPSQQQAPPSDSVELSRRNPDLDHIVESLRLALQMELQGSIIPSVLAGEENEGATAQPALPVLAPPPEADEPLALSQERPSVLQEPLDRAQTATSPQGAPLEEPAPARFAATSSAPPPPQKSAAPEEETSSGAPSASPEKIPRGQTGEELSEEEKREVERLKKRDQEVRAHEQAHLAATGPYVRGGPRYEYERGPDNRQYATGGEVDIDTSEVPNDPQATIRKAQTVHRAALAPAEPSPQDRRVAAEASRLESKARRELAEQRLKEQRGEEKEQDVHKPGDAAAVPPTQESLPPADPQSQKVAAPEPFRPGDPSGADKFTGSTRGEAGLLLDLVA